MKTKACAIIAALALALGTQAWAADQTTPSVKTAPQQQTVPDNDADDLFGRKKRRLFICAQIFDQCGNMCERLYPNAGQEQACKDDCKRRRDECENGRT